MKLRRHLFRDVLSPEPQDEVTSVPFPEQTCPSVGPQEVTLWEFVGGYAKEQVMISN